MRALPLLAVHCTTPSHHPTLSDNIEHTVERVPRVLLRPLMPQTLRKYIRPLLRPAQNPASVPLLTLARKRVWMALHARAQCTARLLLAHQQKQGRQRAGIRSCDSEEDGMGEDWSVYCALADLRQEERVKGGWCVCVWLLLAFEYHSLFFVRVVVRVTFTLKVARCGALTLLHSRLRTEPSRRRLWLRQIQFGRENSPS
jgi:hypothetical protein